MKRGPKTTRPDPVPIVVDGEPCLKVPLTKGMWALIDQDDAPLVLAHRWCVQWTGKGGRRIWYAARRRRVSEGGTRKSDHVRLHHFLLGTSRRIDHQNGDGLDNRRRNLRFASVVQNNGNARLRIDSTTGFKGVFFRQVKGANKTPAWRAIIGDGRSGGSKRHLGYFKNPIDAARAYNAAAISRWGEFAKLNIIPQQKETP